MWWVWSVWPDLHKITLWRVFWSWKRQKRLLKSKKPLAGTNYRNCFTTISLHLSCSFPQIVISWIRIQKGKWMRIRIHSLAVLSKLTKQCKKNVFLNTRHFTFLNNMLWTDANWHAWRSKCHLILKLGCHFEKFVALCWRILKM